MRQLSFCWYGLCILFRHLSSSRSHPTASINTHHWFPRKQSSSGPCLCCCWGFYQSGVTYWWIKKFTLVGGNQHLLKKKWKTMGLHRVKAKYHSMKPGYVCLCVYAHTYMCMHVSIQARGQPRVTFVGTYPPCFLFLSELGAIFHRLVSLRVCLHFPSTRTTSTHYQEIILKGCEATGWWEKCQVSVPEDPALMAQW